MVAPGPGLGPFERRESIPGGLTATSAVLRFSRRQVIHLPTASHGVTDPRFFGSRSFGSTAFAFGTFPPGGNWPKHTGPDGSLDILDQVLCCGASTAFKFGGE